MPVHRLDRAGREALCAVIQQELVQNRDVSFAYLFGSVLEPEGFRDVDVAIWTIAGADASVDVDLAGRLTRRLQLPVDVRRVNDAPVSFLFHVLRGHPLVVRDDLMLANLLERTARQYHDQAPLVRQATRDAFAA